MKKLLMVLTALFFVGATVVPLAVAKGMNSTAMGSGLKKGLVKPHPKPKKHKKKAHPVNKGLEESTEKGLNGPENGGVPSGGKAGGTTIKR